MQKFPQLLFLLAFALQARGDWHWSRSADESRENAASATQFVAIPEPGVLVALISGATILLARRRR